jgi:antitoxin ParD1/3/4
MTTMNISLPEELKAFVDRQVAGRYSTSSEYVRELIRREQDKQKLRDMLLEGANSPPAGPADDAWFEELRQHAASHAKK